MTLADILTARAASARATAAVNCGALGSVTVEALPLRDLERFSSGPDGDRGIFYAACRELQQAGQQLFDKGKTVRPDGVTAFLSDSEARLAADTVRRLSGWTAVTQADDALELSGSAPDQESEVRLSSVQKNSPEQDAEDEVRLESVQENLPEQDAEGEIQPESERENSSEQDAEGEVQPEAMRENSSELDAEDEIQPEAVQENSSEQNAEGEIRPKAVRENSSEQDTEGEIRPEAVRENSSEQDAEGKIRAEAVQENERDFFEARQDIVQENWGKTGHGQVSREFSEKDPKNSPLPEISDKTQTILPVNSFRAQDVGDRAKEALHESKPNYAGKAHLNLHETEPDFPKDLHETESELVESSSLNLHETGSESAERIARQLLEGLRQASWVR